MRQAARCAAVEALAGLAIKGCAMEGEFEVPDDRGKGVVYLVAEGDGDGAHGRELLGVGELVDGPLEPERGAAREPGPRACGKVS